MARFFEDMAVLPHMVQRNWWLLLPIAAAVAWAHAQGFAGLYGQDPHDYLHRAEAWYAWLHGEGRPAHSPHPQLYPLLGALVGVIGGPWSGLRLVSIGAYLGVVHIVRLEVDRRSSDRGANNAFVLLAVAASPFMLRHALFVMSDMLCLLFVMIAYRQAVLFRADGKGHRTMITALCAGAALATRFAAAPPFLAIGVHILRTIIHQRAWKAALAGLFGKGLLAVLVLVLLGRSETPFWHHPWLTGWSPMNFFRHAFQTVDGAGHYPLPNILHALSSVVHPGFLPLGCALVFLFRRSDLQEHATALAVGMFLLDAFFLAGVPFQNDRFLLLTQPLVALALFPAFLRLWSRWPFSSGPRVGLVAAIALMQVLLFGINLRAFVRMTREERALAAVVSLHPERPLYQFSMAPALRTYGVRGELIDLWSTDVAQYPAGSLLLFNAPAFEHQWQGMRVMRNWERAKSQRPTLIATADEGWALYRFDR